MKRDVSEKDVLELLESRVSSLKSKLKRAEDALIILKGKSGEDAKIDSQKLKKSRFEIPIEYDSNFKWDEKILYALSRSKIALKEDIVREIYKLEPEQDMDKLFNLIGVKLSSLLKLGVIEANREGRKFKYKLNGHLN